jgi:tetratricopeptide (TPR) repeat protein
MTRRVLGVGLLCLVAGCAGALRSAPERATETDTSRGWAALATGDTPAARASFAKALARDPVDAGALFGVANLAFEHGEVEVALARALDLLEAAGQGRPEAVALSAAMLARVPRLLSEIPDRRSAEDRLARLLASDPRRLPWRARYALGLIVLETARRREDADLLARTQSRIGCVRAIAQVGTGGRLPLLDLSAETFTALPRPRPLLGVGCQVQLHTSDGRMGVKVLRSEIESAEGAYDLVLDYAGAAELRLDGGAWRAHGSSLSVYEPRWSALRVDLGAGKHVLEVRLGMHGQTAEFALVAMPARKAAGSEPSASAAAASSPMVELARVLEANLVGDSDSVLTHIERLVDHPRFALGLAAAGRLGEMDPTRPVDVTRDKARALWQQAVAVDTGMARVWLDLSNLELQRDRPREAAAHAERAKQASPAWWPAAMGWAAALRAQGLEQPADEALAAGLAVVAAGHGGCQMIERAFQRKEDREDLPAAARLVEALGRCDAQSPQPRTWAQQRGDLDGALALLVRALPTSAEPLWLRSELADVRMARGELERARRVLAESAALAPRDSRTLIRLADIQAALGQRDAARATLGEALRRFPARQEVYRAARVAGLAVPLDDFRVDGAQVIRDFRASGRTYQAPAVVVLDRAVERVFSDGARLLLTHTITQVLSKNAIEHVGEVLVPPGALVLSLRTRKADGSVREAEEISGKPSISTPNLEVGDFVEAETLEFKEPREAFAPGFLGERFFFQSFDAPLDRSEYVFIAPAGTPLVIDRRANPPAANERAGADGTRVLTFVAREQPQLFPERAAVPALEWIPSLRVSSGITLAGWSRYVAERFARVPRGSPEVRAAAAEIDRLVGHDRAKLPAAIVAWVREHIEPETDFTEPATETLAHGRGNRAGLIIALARSLGVPADLVLARSRYAVAAAAPIVPSELDDFRDVLVRFSQTDGDRFVDPQLRRAPFAFLHSGDDGSKAVVVGTSQVIPVATAVPDSRKVTLRARLQADGSAEVVVTEEVAGWPAVEWGEMLDRTGKDRTKLRQGFEQQWLGHHFPGAQLQNLEVVPGESSTRVSYSFKAASFADRGDHLLLLRPTFFRSQPGRRFATEPLRKTTLALGYDIPLDLDAQIALPPGARVLDLGQSGTVRAGEALFVEERRLQAGNVVELHRSARLPLMRVAPADYQNVAAQLRAVDPMEQAEIRIAVPAEKGN